MSTFEILTIAGVPTLAILIWEALATFVFQNGRKAKAQKTAEKKGIQALLRNELMTQYKLYIAQGWIAISEKENYNNMYLSYHNLGKNGVMDAMYKEVMELPTK